MSRQINAQPIAVGASVTDGVALQRGRVLPRRLVLVAGLSLLLGVALVDGLATRRPVTSRIVEHRVASHGPLSGFPLALQGAVSGTVGADEGAYRVRVSADGLRASSPAQNLGLRFDRAGVRVTSKGMSIGLSLRAMGYGNSLRPAGRVTPHARADHVVYARLGLSESYVNGPLGLEQVFTVPRAPTSGSAEPLTLSMAFRSDLRASLVSGGQSVAFGVGDTVLLRYGDLVARDARGRTLHSWLELRGDNLLLRLDARGARFPLRIDPLIQQGTKLTGGGESGQGFFGSSVALSADGNTALIGAPSDNKGTGAAWVFIRSGTTWVQQGSKLTGSGEVGEGHAGKSVALSGDGNTALIGGENDSSAAGAAWVFTRSGTTWTQQGSKITNKEASEFGSSVALSYDGNTALIVGGATYVYTRAEGKWAEQGTLKNGVGAFEVALSDDGNTALLGSPDANSRVGLASVFVRSQGKWTQQGANLTGAEETGEGFFGSDVALSGDGNTALIGGQGDNEFVGAAWVFHRSEGKWTPQSAKLKGSGEIEHGNFGIAVALSYNGRLALIGAYDDHKNLGAIWEFAIPEVTWAQQGGKLIAKEELGASQFGNSIALSADGETSLVAGLSDNISVGAVWAFTHGFTPEELYGPENPSEPNQPPICSGRPVNCATGNQVETQADLTVGGRPGLHVTRTYNSQLAASQSEPEQPSSFGWMIPYGSRLTLDKECFGEYCRDDATVRQENGSTVKFQRSVQAKAWSTGPSVQSTLVQEGSTYTFALPNQSTLIFNSAGYLTSETDRNGNTVTMTRNPEEEDLLETVTDEAGRTLTFTYSEEGRIESIKDPMGHTVKYTYEEGNLMSVTEPGEKSPRWKFGYDPSHQMTSMTDGRGNTVTTEYDGSHRVIAQTDGMERKRKWAYATTTSGTETTITEPNGAVTTEQFDSIGMPTSITHAVATSLAATTTYEYDAANNLIAETDPNKHTTSYSYDIVGNRTSATDANGNQTKWTYNNTHDVETMTTPKGEKTTIKRDNHGNPETIERAASGGKTQKTTYKYDSHGNLTGETDPLERTRTYEYDKQGDRESETDPEGDKRTWTYNKDSQETSTVSPRGNVKGAEAERYTTKIERDEQGRPTAVTDSLGHTTTHTYDSNGNIETLTDGNGHKITYTYNADDEPVATKAPNGTTSETEYDSAGQAIAHIDGNSHATKYVRNLLEQIVEEIDPRGRTTAKNYDLAGNQTKLIDPLKRTTKYTYDPANRLTEVSYSDGKTSTVKYEYDKDGLRTGMTDGTGKTSYTFDQLARLTHTTDGHGDSTSYEYDLANEQTKLTYPNKNLVTRGYDKAGRLQTVTDWLGHQTKFSYNPDSATAIIAFPTSTTNQDKYAYNELDQTSEVKFTKGTETLASLAYTRDADGQVKKTTSKGLPGEEAIEYIYDEDNRLTKAGGTVYEYDAANNPTKIVTSIYTYDNADELETGTGFKYTYDELGERAKSTPSTAATTYGYDQAGNLIAVERPAEGKIPAISDTYTYDGNGLRASQTKGKITSNLTWDFAESLPLLANDGTNSYIYGPNGIPIEQIDNTTGTVIYLHHDQQGSTRLLTNSSGTKEATLTYDAYGNTIATTGTATSPLGYDGQYTSSDTGLIYLRTRAYDPATVQFLNVDPIAAITRAPYTYAGNNPLTFGDPMGLWSPTESLERLSDEIGETISNVGGGFIKALTGGLVDGSGNSCSTGNTVGEWGALALGALLPEELGPTLFRQLAERFPRLAAYLVKQQAYQQVTQPGKSTIIRSAIEKILHFLG